MHQNTKHFNILLLTLQTTDFQADNHIQAGNILKFYKFLVNFIDLPPVSLIH